MKRKVNRMESIAPTKMRKTDLGRAMHSMTDGISLEDLVGERLLPAGSNDFAIGTEGDKDKYLASVPVNLYRSNAQVNENRPRMQHFSRPLEVQENATLSVPASIPNVFLGNVNLTDFARKSLENVPMAGNLDSIMKKSSDQGYKTSDYDPNVASIADATTGLGDLVSLYARTKARRSAMKNNDRLNTVVTSFDGVKTKPPPTQGTVNYSKTNKTPTSSSPRKNVNDDDDKKVKVVDDDDESEYTKWSEFVKSHLYRFTDWVKTATDRQNMKEQVDKMTKGAQGLINDAAEKYNAMEDDRNARALKRQEDLVKQKEEEIKALGKLGGSIQSGLQTVTAGASDTFNAVVAGSNARALRLNDELVARKKAEREAFELILNTLGNKTFDLLDSAHSKALVIGSGLVDDGLQPAFDQVMQAFEDLPDLDKETILKALAAAATIGITSAISSKIRASDVVLEDAQEGEILTDDAVIKDVDHPIKGVADEEVIAAADKTTLELFYDRIVDAQNQKQQIVEELKVDAQGAVVLPSADKTDYARLVDMYGGGAVKLGDMYGDQLDDQASKSLVLPQQQTVMRVQLPEFSDFMRMLENTELTRKLADAEGALGRMPSREEISQMPDNDETREYLADLLLQSHRVKMLQKRMIRERTGLLGAYRRQQLEVMRGEAATLAGLRVKADNDKKGAVGDLPSSLVQLRTTEERLKQEAPRMSPWMVGGMAFGAVTIASLLGMFQSKPKKVGQALYADLFGIVDPNDLKRASAAPGPPPTVHVTPPAPAPAPPAIAPPPTGFTKIEPAVSRALAVIPQGPLPTSRAREPLPTSQAIQTSSESDAPPKPEELALIKLPEDTGTTPALGFTTKPPRQQRPPTPPPPSPDTRTFRLSPEQVAKLKFRADMRKFKGETINVAGQATDYVKSVPDQVADKIERGVGEFGQYTLQAARALGSKLEEIPAYGSWAYKALGRNLVGVKASMREVISGLKVDKAYANSEQVVASVVDTATSRNLVGEVTDAVVGMDREAFPQPDAVDQALRNFKMKPQQSRNLERDKLNLELDQLTRKFEISRQKYEQEKVDQLAREDAIRQKYDDKLREEDPAQWIQRRRQRRLAFKQQFEGQQAGL